LSIIRQSRATDEIPASYSDTTAVTLANILNYLVTCPPVCQHLQKVVDGIFPEGDEAFDYDKIKNIPYLDAIINETLRLKPVIPSGQPRLTPPGGLQVDEVWIPRDTIVSIPQWIMFRDERYFVRATEFLPERWLEEKDLLVKDERAFFPFSLGESFCLGMSHRLFW
jgi:cytochrome P450